jgi:hypothetical protein
MSTPTPSSDRSVPSQKLVQELLAMRDALVTLSLCLKDWQFELDQQGRQSAQREAAEVLGPMRLKPPVRDNRVPLQGPGDSSAM